MGNLDEPSYRADLDAWVLATWSQAVAYALSLLQDRTLAEDVVHDCYCRLLEKADVYDLLHDGTRLLMSSVTNAAINRNTRKRPLLRLSVGEENSSAEREIKDPTAQEPVQVLMEHELEQVIAQGLALLPVPQRAAIELKSLGHSLQEIADSLGVSPSNAGVLVHRARQTLARHLATYTQEKV